MAIYGPAKPDPKEVMDFKVHYDNLWSGARAKWDVALAFYLRTRAVWIDAKGVEIQGSENRSCFQPSTGTSIVDHAADQHFAYSPKVHCYPAGDGKAHNEKAGLKEKWMTAVLNDCAGKVPYLLFRQIIKQFGIYGYSPVLGPTLNLDDMPEEPPEPEREKDDDDERYNRKVKSYQVALRVYKGGKINFNPFRIEVPPPSWVLMDPFDLEPTCVITVLKVETWKLNEFAVKKKMEQLRGAQREVYDVPAVDEKNRFTMVDCTELWTPYWHELYRGTSVGADRIFSEPNPWGFIPAAHAYSGNGMESAAVEKRRDRDPAQLCVGLLEPVFDELIMLAMQINGQHQAAMDDSYPHPMAEDEEQALQLARAVTESGVGVGKKDSAWYMVRPAMAPFVEQVEQSLLRRIEVATFNLQASGFKEAGVDTATQQMILTNASQKKFIPVQKQLENLVTGLAQRIFKQAQILFDRGIVSSITVQGVTLTLDDIDGITDCAVTFPSVDPVVKQTLMGLSMQEVAAGLKTEREHYEEFGGEDWEGHQDQKVREMMGKHPYDITFRMAKLAKADGDNEMAAALEAQLPMMRADLVAQVAQMMNPQLAMQAGDSKGSGAPAAGNGVRPSA